MSSRESLLARWVRKDFQRAIEPFRYESYFLAMRHAASKALGVSVGRVVPLDNEATRERLYCVAQRQRRPVVEVVRILDGAEFLLLVDTKKK